MISCRKEPYVELPQVSPIANNKKYRPKHSFDKLIKDATGETAILANESFWKSIKTVEIDDDIVEDNSFDQNDLELEETLLESDQGVPFPFNNRQTELKLPKEESIYKLERLCGDGKRSTMEKFIEKLILCERANLKHLFYFLVNTIETHFDQLEIDKLWYLWRPSHYLKNFITSSSDNQFSLSQILIFNNRIISQCNDCISKDDINLLFTLFCELICDPLIYDKHSKELSEFAQLIVAWLDVPRIHLLLEWTNQNAPIVAHHERIVRMAKLLSGTDLGLLATNIIMDSIIFRNLEDYKGNEGDDYEFITFLPLILPNISNLRTEFSKLILIYHRLMRTGIENDFKESVQILTDKIKSIRSAIPNSHFQLYITAKDVYSKMETYLKTFLIRLKKGIIRL